MKVIFISDNGNHHKKINLKLWAQLVIPLFILSLITIAITVIASKNHQAKISIENHKISENEIKLLDKFDLLLKKVATLEAEVDRLNTLGTALANKSKLDIKTFKLEEVPARGGLSESFDSQDAAIISEAELVESIREIEQRLAQGKVKLSNFQKYMEIERKQQELNDTVDSISTYLKTASFYASPVNKGYISSTYGARHDPINGSKRHHNGIDIAAKHGSKINAIASGFVTFAGRKGGYGNVIEIHHSKSLKSRYAHLDTIKVKKGKVVHQGDVIATMGKTGRATGSHLHLEVWENDEPTNPESFINIALTNLKYKN